MQKTGLVRARQDTALLIDDLVLLGHSLLMAQLRQGCARAWATETLLTIDEACRAVLRDTLGKPISWAIERATWDGGQPNRIEAHLALC